MSESHDQDPKIPADFDLSETRMADLPGATSFGPTGDAAGPNSPFTPGQVIGGRYEIRELLGAGGMGAVYAAFDRMRDKEIALKVLLPRLTAHEQSRQRFLNEARLASELSHPHIVNVFDIGQEGEIFYLTMEKLEGETLRARLEALKQAGEAMSLEEALEITKELGEALTYAHEVTVHRDLKPENVMLTPNGVKLMDFGIARLLRTSQLTMTGMALGTAYYMAPEQLQGGEVDARADQYSLGVMLYEMVSGRLPAGLIKPLHTLIPEVPVAISESVNRTLEGDPAERHESVAAFVGDLAAPRKVRRGGKSPARGGNQETSAAGVAPSESSKSKFLAAIGLVLLLVAGIATLWHAEISRGLRQMMAPANAQADLATLERRWQEASATWELQAEVLPGPAPGEAAEIAAADWRAAQESASEHRWEGTLTRASDAVELLEGLVGAAGAWKAYEEAKLARAAHPGLAQRGLEPWRAAAVDEVSAEVATLRRLEQDLSTWTSQLERGSSSVLQKLERARADWRGSSGGEVEESRHGPEAVSLSREAQEAEARGLAALGGPEHARGLAALEAAALAYESAKNRLEAFEQRQLESARSRYERARVAADAAYRAWEEARIDWKRECEAVARQRAREGEEASKAEAILMQAFDELIFGGPQIREAQRLRQAPALGSDPDVYRAAAAELAQATTTFDKSLQLREEYLEAVESGALKAYTLALSVVEAAAGLGEIARSVPNLTPRQFSKRRAQAEHRVEEGLEQWLSGHPAKAAESWRTHAGLAEALTADLLTHAESSESAQEIAAALTALRMVDAVDSPDVLRRMILLEGRLGPTEATVTSSLGTSLIRVSPGTFWMGSPASEEGRDDDEVRHEVTLTRPFYLGKTEVTQGEWSAVMGSEPWSGKDYVRSGSRYPAVYVNWSECVEFCKRLTARDREAGVIPGHWAYRLPTEAEWEYACRAGSASAYSFGSSASRLGRYAWYEENAWDVDEKYAHTVGTKSANAWGFHDMHGNVWEWCQDWAGAYPTGPVTDPVGASGGSSRVIRGGCFNYPARFCRSADRIRVGPGDRDNDLGFRLALSRVP